MLDRARAAGLPVDRAEQIYSDRIQPRLIQSLSRFVLQRRLAHCRHDLLHDRDASVTAIAFRWGFNDAAYFSRAFRRAHGISPRALRAAVSS